MVYYPLPLQGSSYGMVELFWVRPLFAPNMNESLTRPVQVTSLIMFLPCTFHSYSISMHLALPLDGQYSCFQALGGPPARLVW
jgi:hypothetical protein